MWLMTTSGFYSIVEKSPGTFQIRARVRRDLENLVHGAGLQCDIVETPSADYGFRVVTTKQGVATALAWLASRINYSNFKSAIDKIPDQQKKHQPYMSIWTTLYFALGGGGLFRRSFSRSAFGGHNETGDVTPDEAGDDTVEYFRRKKGKRRESYQKHFKSFLELNEPDKVNVSYHHGGFFCSECATRVDRESDECHACGTQFTQP